MAQAAARAVNESEAFDAGLEAYRSGRFDEAMEILSPFIDGGTSNYGLWNLHGLVLRELERREEAIASLRRAAQLAPNSPKIAHALARILFEAGLPSIQEYGRAVKLSPGDTEIVAGMATACTAEGEADAAIDGLERLLSRSPQWAEGHALLSRLRWAQGERQGFDRSFEQAIAVMPGNIDLWREWIIALEHAELWQETLEVAARGRAVLGDEPLFAVTEAIVYSEIGECERAEQLFAPFADIEDSTVQLRRIRHYLRWGRPADAEKIIEKWVEKPEAIMFWPYASIAWRLLDDPRWHWLEGDERFVGVYDIADRLPPLDLLADTLRKLHKMRGQPLEQSLRGGTQTEGDIFTRVDPVLVELREAIRKTVAEHVGRFPKRDERHPLLGPPRGPIRFSGSWSVRLKSKGFHANHVHPAGWISSALYIALPPDVGTGEAGILTLGDPSGPNFDVRLQPFRTVQPKPGRLALFPSYMWHGTRPFGEGERLTVAFDVAIPAGADRPAFQAQPKS